MRLNPKHQRQMANLSIKTSFRSGLEARIAEQISEAGLAVEYETDRIGFHWPERLARYTPDFKLPKAGGGYFFIEVKGRWETADRQKMLLVRQQNPDLDIRMLFQRASNKLYKRSPLPTQSGVTNTASSGVKRRSQKIGWKRRVTMQQSNSQNQKIEYHLHKTGSITALEAWDSYRVRSLPRRIKDLREKGIHIQSETKYDLQGQRYVRYVLQPPEKSDQLQLL